MNTAAEKLLIYHFTRDERGQAVLAHSPVTIFSSFPIHSLEGAIKYLKNKTRIGIGPLSCVCIRTGDGLRIAWTEDKGMERIS